jgi:hypothetical protein
MVTGDNGDNSPQKSHSPSKTVRFLHHNTVNIRGAFAALERTCPEYVAENAWRRAVADGRDFLDLFGARAEELGWTVEELFGLHEPPANPHPSYNRLARY